MLNKRLKELRIQRSLTQKEVANIFNMSNARYNQYETGKRTPDYETLNTFADFYNVSVDYLLGRTNLKNYEYVYEPGFLELLKELQSRSALQNLLLAACETSDDEILKIHEYIEFILYQNAKKP